MTSLKTYAVVGSAVLGFGAILLWKISTLSTEVGTLKQQNTQLEAAVDVQDKLITDVMESSDLIKQAHNELSSVVIEQSNDVQDLRDRLTRSANSDKRSLEKLAAAKSAMVEKIINRASKRALRCMEIASGSELRADDFNNPECPNLTEAPK